MMKDVAPCTGLIYTGFVDPDHEPRRTIMQQLFDFLDRHQRLNAACAVVFGVLVLALDSSTYCP